MITMAKGTLVEAASKSKGVFVMGYCAPKPYIMQPQGFEATLGVMDNPKMACWHLFKKGFCRHGPGCIKQHPLCKVPVRVLIQGVHLNSNPQFIRSFKQEVADLAMTMCHSLLAKLGDNTCVDQVEAVKENDGQGWTIEVTSKEESSPYKEYVLGLAKSALFSTTSVSDTVYILGYAAQPFVSKSQGFVAILGDMQDDTQACWDMYSKGKCSRDCVCRWQHPECYMPINVIFKEEAPLKRRPSQVDAVLEYLVDTGKGSVSAKRAFM
jgi:hypothetical protein